MVVKGEKERLPAGSRFSGAKVGVVQHVVGVAVALLAALLVQPGAAHRHDALALPPGDAVAHEGKAEGNALAAQFPHPVYGFVHCHAAKVSIYSTQEKDTLSTDVPLQVLEVLDAVTHLAGVHHQFFLGEDGEQAVVLLQEDDHLRALFRGHTRQG